MGEPNHSTRKGGNPVTAFFRGLYTEMAFSKESLRLNGQGLLFGRKKRTRNGLIMV